MATMTEEITEAMLAEFTEHDIPDTTENRIVFLQGVWDAWQEDTEYSFGKLGYQLILWLEISRLRRLAR